MRVGDSVAWWKGDLLIVNGVRYGTVTDYDVSTGTITFQRFGLWKRVRLWLSGLFSRKGKKQQCL